MDDQWGRPKVKAQLPIEFDKDDFVIPLTKRTVQTEAGPRAEVRASNLVETKVNADRHADLSDGESSVGYVYINDVDIVRKECHSYNERTQKLITYQNYASKKGKEPVNEINNFIVVLKELQHQATSGKDDLKVQRILEGFILRLKDMKHGNAFPHHYVVPEDVKEFLADNVQDGHLSLEWIINGFQTIEEVDIDRWVALDHIFKYYWSHHSPNQFYDGLYSFWRSNFPKTFNGKVASYFESKPGHQRHLGKNNKPDGSKEGQKAGKGKAQKKKQGKKASN
jgi:hypothetical protein